MTLNPDVVRARCGDIEDALSRHLGDLRSFTHAVTKLVDPPVD